MNRKRVIVAGLGDAGVLAAIRLSRHADVVGISAKPALVSGQELGVRLSRPHDWARDYWIPFDRFRRLDGVRTVQATLTGVDLAARTVFGRTEDGATITEAYDALIISTGVSNGFWRQPTLQSAAEIGAALRSAHDRLAAAASVVVVGGGAAAVSSAAQHGNHVAGQADRPVLPRRLRSRGASSANMAAHPRPTDPAGRRRAPGSPRGGDRRVRGR